MIVPDVLPDLAADLKKRDKISAHKLDSALNITANVTEMVKFRMGSITCLVIKFAKALNKLQILNAFKCSLCKKNLKIWFIQASSLTNIS